TLTLTAGQLAANPLPGSGTLTMQETTGNSVTLNNAATGQVTFGGTGNLTFTNPITAAAAANLFVNNTTTFAGQLTGAALTMAGSGTLAMTASNAAYGSAVTINGGTLALSGTGGSLVSSTSITVNNTGTLLLDDSVNAAPGRLAATTPLNLNG